MEYADLNDFELVYQVRERDSIAYDALLKKYSHLIEMLARRYLRKNKNIGLEYEDLFQEGMVGFFKALDDYEPSNTLFYTYVLLCSKREMERLIKGCTRMKHVTLNESCSLSKPLTDDEDILLEDVIPSSYNLEEEYESQELYNKLVNLKYNLCFSDSQIYELKLNDFTIKEIAALLDEPYKKVDNRWRKIKEKLLQII